MIHKDREMSFEAVSERLKSLQDTNSQLRDLIDRLANINFQPGSIPLDDDENNVKVELTSEIHQIIKDQDEDLVILQEDIIDLGRKWASADLEQQKAILDRGVKKALEDLKVLVKAFRRAQLSAKQNLEEAQRKERKLLLQSWANPLPPDSTPATSPKRRNQQLSEPSKDEKTINASTDVTLALRRTHDLMASELSRSQFAHDTLQQSTAALAQLSENYSTLDTLLSSSKNLLGTLLRSQKSDTWYLETAFYVLLATIAWLVFRRFIYGPAWWLLWFPVKIFWKSTASALGVTGLVGSTNYRSRAIITHNKDTRNLISTTAVSEFSKTNIGDNSQATASTNVPLGGGSVSEQVGQIVDKNRDGAGDQKPWVASNNEAAGGDAASRNPMKRMWEADKEARQEIERKDEL